MSSDWDVRTFLNFQFITVFFMIVRVISTFLKFFFGWCGFCGWSFTVWGVNVLLVVKKILLQSPFQKSDLGDKVSSFIVIVSFFNMISYRLDNFFSELVILIISSISLEELLIILIFDLVMHFSCWYWRNYPPPPPTLYFSISVLNDGNWLF